jgi:8-oxo-dGTP pyrophosphatase MutT (NUDIX family)
MKILKEKTLWEGKFLRTTLIQYAGSFSPEAEGDTAQTIRDWESVGRVNCNGIAGLVPITEDREVILIRQFRPPIKGYVIELPAGLCDIGELPEEAAARELIEETGYSAGNLTFLIKGPLSSGSSSEILSVFTATGLSYVGVGKRDDNEDIEVLKVRVEDLYSRLEELQDEGDHIDLKIFGLVELAKRALGKTGSVNHF